MLKSLYPNEQYLGGSSWFDPRYGGSDVHPSYHGPRSFQVNSQ
jgi:hypothetical protein